MDLAIFRQLVDRSPSVRNLLPYQWGEPLMHPHLYDCIAYASQRGKRVMLTTNGTLLDEEACEKILVSGLDRLAVSFDGNKETHGKIRQVDPYRILENLKRFKRIRDRMGATCALDVSMVVSPVTEPHVDEFRAIFSDLADRIQFIPIFERGKRIKVCRELWRGVLVVLSNGDVTLCCADPKGELTLGNIKDSSPAELYNSRIMGRIRQRHAKGDFPFPCRGCSEYASNHVSPRFS
jgi:MoaA/NifB/PqqE/SkfB family radical SAM enzyme